MTGDALPARRQNRIIEIGYHGQILSVYIDHDAEGRPMAVFADGHPPIREGSAMQAFLDDACVLISLALQRGIGPAELAHGLAVVPAFHDGREIETHASPVGAIVAALQDQSEPPGSVT